MKITELLTKKTILLDIEGNQKETAIDQLVGILYKAGKITNKAEFKAAILKREEQSTTGIGEGIAIPHAKVTAVKEAAIAFAQARGLSFTVMEPHQRTVRPKSYADNFAFNRART